MLETRRLVRHRLSRVLGTLGLIAVVAAAATPASAGAPPPKTPWPGGVWQPEAPTYGMAVQSNLTITMDDGVQLVANVGYPTDPATGERASGKFPVLLVQTPYAALGQGQPDPYFVDRGYIVAMVQVRGTASSGGAFGYFSTRDTQDGVELVDWAAHDLAGSNGIVGLQGCSYVGMTQVFTAAAVGPNSPVKAMIPACATGDQYSLDFVGGIPSSALLGSSFNSNPNSLWGQRAAVFLNPVYNNIFSGGDEAYDGQFWQGRSFLTFIKQIVDANIPTLLYSGWQSPEVGAGPISFYTELQNAYSGRPLLAPMDADQRTTGRDQLIIGPGTHGQGVNKEFQLEWYDTWLKGIKTDIQDTRTPMHLYELGSNRWVNTSSNPIVSNYTSYRLGSGGTLSVRPSGGAMTASDSLAWGPPAVAGGTLSYTSRPLKHGATWAGPGSVSVYASSSNTNLELIADLYDVAPGGSATRITTGALVGSLRAENPALSWYDEQGLLIQPYHPFLADSYAQPGTVHRYDINLLAQLRAIPPGDSLRLTLSTQAPASDCNPLVLGNSHPCDLTLPQQQTIPGGVYQIYSGRWWPSAVSMPLLRFGALPTAASGVTPTSGGQTEPLYWGPKGGAH